MQSITELPLEQIKPSQIRAVLNTFDTMVIMIECLRKHNGQIVPVSDELGITRQAIHRRLRYWGIQKHALPDTDELYLLWLKGGSNGHTLK